METYRKWENVPPNLKTKTQLKELKLKPIDLNDYVAKFHSYYGDFFLYDMAKTKQIKVRKEIDVDSMEINADIIAEALYLINKSAKKSRDSKQKNYNHSNHSQVARSKERENNLYDLKDEVLQKLKKLQWVEIKGYHKQELHGQINYLQLIQLNNFTFHQMIEEKNISSLNNLGDIGIIPAIKKIKTSITYTEAILLLNKFIKKPQS